MSFHLVVCRCSSRSGRGSSAPQFPLWHDRISLESTSFSWLLAVQEGLWSGILAVHELFMRTAILPFWQCFQLSWALRIWPPSASKHDSLCKENILYKLLHKFRISSETLLYLQISNNNNKKPAFRYISRITILNSFFWAKVVSLTALSH